MSSPSPTPPLAHNVYFWMNNPDDAEEADRLVAGLNTLADVTFVRAFRLAKPAATAARDVVDSTYSYHLTLFFDNADDQNAYQSDPIHQRFVEGCSSLWKRVAVYDSDASLL